jgi:CDP-diacylglycerol---glycerol-3-phosphate 3-phosphatidyltransferase
MVMLNVLARASLGRVLTPIGSALARAGVSPDVVTVLGTTGVVASSLGLYATGHLVWGSFAVTFFVLTDLLDGAIARATPGRSSRWGAFLDSTMDRIADASIFAALTIWWYGDGDEPVLGGLALFCLVAGAIVSYAKARAEGLGMTCNVGLAERAERLILVLAGVGLGAIFDVELLFHVAMWLLAAASVVTVVQRIREVHRQAVAPVPPAPLPPAAVPPADLPPAP